TFLNNIFYLEIYGLDKAYFSIINIPSIFKTITTNIITTIDKELIRYIIKIYIRNLKIVILIVIPANVNSIIQEILKIAKKINSNCYYIINN
ncbi:hypothetical protein K469DRAFT_583115, partial [Zopfia rhizophila CBS 207.26]